MLNTKSTPERGTFFHVFALKQMKCVFTLWCVFPTADRWPDKRNYYLQCYEHQEKLHSAVEVKRCWGDPWKQLRAWESDQTAIMKKETVTVAVTTRRSIKCKFRTMLATKYTVLIHEILTHQNNLTSVIACMEAPYLTSSSITFTLFFLQAMWRGVKPFW